jgi:glycosyl transferase family 25
LHHLKTHIDSINNYFDNIYVLTITRATERHEQLKISLKGLHYQLFFGVDKNNITVDDLEKNYIYNSAKAQQNNRYNKTMTLGEIACSIGHKMIYEDVMKNGFNKVLILEDDVVFNENGITSFSEMLIEAGSNWDILYFDYLKNDKRKFAHYIKQIFYHIQRHIKLLKWSHKTINNLFARSYTKHLKKAGYHDFASAYAINNKTAALLFKLQTPISYPADHVLPYAITNELITGFITVPKIFEQTSQYNKATIGSYVEQ